MTSPMWNRFVEVGERLATESPDFFPTVVLLLETMADADALRELAEGMLGCTLPPPARAPSIEALGDLLLLAEPALADVRELARRLRELLPDERRTAEAWARAQIGARGDVRRQPTLPPCVAKLLARVGQS